MPFYIYKVYPPKNCQDDEKILPIKYFSQINAKNIGSYWNICTFVPSYYYCNLIKDLSYKYTMEHLEVIKVSEEKISSEHLNANKVYFATDILNDSNMMPIYSKLCMVLDIYGVKHELIEDPSTHSCKALKPAWLANNARITDHVDCLVRYIGNKRVLMTNCTEYDTEVAAALKEKIEAEGYEVVELSYSSFDGARGVKDTSWAYINYIQTSKVIIVPMQRAKEDKEALQQIKACFPHLAVVGVYAEPCLGNEGEFICYSKSIDESMVS